VRALPSPGLVLAIAVAVVALPAAASGALPSGEASPARVAANSVTYQDSTGENPAAPDITTVVASNNDAAVISLRINIPNRATLTQDMLVVVWIDSDNNPQTGDPDSLGADYILFLFRGDLALGRWDGTDYADAPATSLIFSYQAGVTFTISASELGNTRRFGFATRVFSGLVIDETTGAIDFANAATDDAPGAIGFYNFELQITPPTLLIRRVTTSPATPRAGRTFTVRMVAARSDTGAALQNGRVTCVGRAGNTRLRAQVARVTGGAVTCTWLIPAKAKGKTFRGSVTVVFEGLRASRSISRRIA
jgi:hypothetical protein